MSVASSNKFPLLADMIFVYTGYMLQEDNRLNTTGNNLLR